MDEINVTNFSPSGTEGELRTIAFGPTGSMKLLLEMEVDDSDNVRIDLTLSNACNNDELKDFIVDMSTLLAGVADAMEENND